MDIAARRHGWWLGQRWIYSPGAILAIPSQTNRRRQANPVPAFRDTTASAVLSRAIQRDQKSGAKLVGKGVNVLGATARWGGRRNDRAQKRARGFYDHISTTHFRNSIDARALRAYVDRAALRGRNAGRNRTRRAGGAAGRRGRVQ